jgi:CheY-like chemotaxis protein
MLQSAFTKPDWQSVDTRDFPSGKKRRIALSIRRKQIEQLLLGGADIPLSRTAPHFYSPKGTRAVTEPDVGRRRSLIAVHSVSQKLILCIDDNPAILSYEEALLQRSGYSVITAASARQGLGLVTLYEFDAVLLDYEMPDMNGCDVAFEIKRVRPHLVVILLSGSEVPTYALLLVDAFILKPAASRELLPTIAALCSHVREPQQKQDGLQP